MSADFSKPITWNSVLRLSLGFGAEYSLLSLIEDAPIALKMATMLCSLGALAALEGRDWLNKKARRPLLDHNHPSFRHLRLFRDLCGRSCVGAHRRP